VGNPVQRRFLEVPTTIIPIGKPSGGPHGTLIAGWWVLLKALVFANGAKTRLVTRLGEALSACRDVAFIGVVGSARASTPSNASSYAARSARTACLARAT